MTLAAVVAVNAVAVPTLTLLLVIDYSGTRGTSRPSTRGLPAFNGRMARPTDDSGVRLEKYLLRAFCLYVIFRSGPR